VLKSALPKFHKNLASAVIFSAEKSTFSPAQTSCDDVFMKGAVFLGVFSTFKVTTSSAST